MKKVSANNTQITQKTCRGQGLYGRYQTHGNEVTNIIAANSKNGGITGIASILGNKQSVQSIPMGIGQAIRIIYKVPVKKTN
jgi:hypothetical protein